MDLQEFFKTKENLVLPEYSLTAEQTNEIRSMLIEMSSSYSTSFMVNAFKMEDAVNESDAKYAKHLLFDCLNYLELWYKMRGIIPHNIHGLSGHWDNYCEKTMSFGKMTDDLLELNTEIDGYSSHWAIGKESIKKARTAFISNSRDIITSKSNEIESLEGKYREYYDGR